MILKKHESVTHCPCLGNYGLLNRLTNNQTNRRTVCIIGKHMYVILENSENLRVRFLIFAAFDICCCCSISRKKAHFNSYPNHLKKNVEKRISRIKNVYFLDLINICNKNNNNNKTSDSKQQKKMAFTYSSIFKQ